MTRAVGKNYPIKQNSFGELSESWKWRTAKNIWVRPSEMNASHLFYTFRMIWNNHAPEHAKVGCVRHYVFNPKIYTKRYFANAIKFMGAELQSREQQLTVWQIAELNEMARHFQNQVTKDKTLDLEVWL